MLKKRLIVTTDDTNIEIQLWPIPLYLTAIKWYNRSDTFKVKSLNVPGVCDKRVPTVKYYHTNVPGLMEHVWVQSSVLKYFECTSVYKCLCENASFCREIRITWNRNPLVPPIKTVSQGKIQYRIQNLGRGTRNMKPKWPVTFFVNLFLQKGHAPWTSGSGTVTMRTYLLAQCVLRTWWVDTIC